MCDINEDEVIRLELVGRRKVYNEESYNRIVAERDRLQETLKRIMKENSDYIDGIESENDRLRVALTNIIELKVTGDGHTDANIMSAIARNALGLT